MNRQQTGRFGEDAAAEYLMRNGYRIVERNFSCKLGEVTTQIVIHWHSIEKAVKPLISRGLCGICSSHIHERIPYPIKKQRSTK